MIIKRGNIYVNTNGERHILAQTLHGRKYSLISLEDGNRWEEPVGLEQELSVMINTKGLDSQIPGVAEFWEKLTAYTNEFTEGDLTKN